MWHTRMRYSSIGWTRRTRAEVLESTGDGEHRKAGAHMDEARKVLSDRKRRQLDPESALDLAVDAGADVNFATGRI